MITRVSTKGQIVLPLKLREKDGITTGQKFEIERIESGEYLLKRVASPIPNEGVVEWLLSCPEKGWMPEPDRNESTDDIVTTDFP